MYPEEHDLMFRVEDAHWWYRGLRAQIRDALPECGAQPFRILDAGCGTGANLAARDPAAARIGADLSPHAAVLCRRRGLTAIACASVTALPFPDGCFDIALCMDVIEHASIADKAAPLRELARVLKPGGLLLLNAPAFQGLHSSHDVAVGQDRRFTRRELRALLEGAGFESVSVRYWNTLLFPIAAAVRLWRQRYPQTESDLAQLPGPRAARMLEAILAVERVLAHMIPFPFGLSLFARAVVTRRD